jgi:hypothetical protein
VPLVAVDCAASRTVVGGYAAPGLVVGVYGILPMSNLLAVACDRNASRHTTGRPFFLGFGLTGVLAIVVYFNLCLTADDQRVLVVITWIENRQLLRDFESSISSGSIGAICHYAIMVLSVAGLTTLPLMVLSLSDGWIARRFGGIAGRSEV